MAQCNHNSSLKSGKSRQTLTITHLNAAGIDIGSGSLFVAVPPDRAAQALRLAAAALRSSKSALGAYFRRLCTRMDKAKAVTAAAHKLARLIYAMLTKGEEYTGQGQDYYEERYRERVLRQLAQQAEKMGMKLVASEQVA
jgi:hypothetical protein